MSRRASRSPETDDAVQLHVVSSAGSSAQVEISLRQSLNDLKTLISMTPSLGNIPEGQQRIFYLGREMKTGGRSLEALGVGRFGVMAIHVHTTKPIQTRACPGVQYQQHSALNEDVEAIEIIEPQQLSAVARISEFKTQEVVDLASDDDDDDDDDGQDNHAVQVFETRAEIAQPRGKRRRL